MSNDQRISPYFAVIAKMAKEEQRDFVNDDVHLSPPPNRSPIIPIPQIRQTPQPPNSLESPEIPFNTITNEDLDFLASPPPKPKPVVETKKPTEPSKTTVKKRNVFRK